MDNPFRDLGMTDNEWEKSARNMAKNPFRFSVTDAEWTFQCQLKTAYDDLDAILAGRDPAHDESEAAKKPDKQRARGRPKNEPLDSHIRNALVHHAVKDELNEQRKRGRRKSIKQALGAIIPAFRYLNLSDRRIRAAHEAGQKIATHPNEVTDFEQYPPPPSDESTAEWQARLRVQLEREKLECRQQDSESKK